MSDQRLLLEMQNGQAAALKELHRRYAPLVYAFVMRRINHPQTAEEITNDAFLHAWRGASSFADRSSGKTWLLAIAKNRALDAMRSQYALQTREVSEDESTLERSNALADRSFEPEVSLGSAQLGVQINACFDKLSADHRECLHLAYIECLSTAEMSQALGIPAGTVATRIYHAKAQLKICLQRKYGGGALL
ncbi:MAG: sigma-70 family RNA polymerase sigma factor [Brachymonas sp.]|nr:sigma-70 family RNA polymerase sigma factor [Brachymonas sp.]